MKFTKEQIRKLSREDIKNILQEQKEEFREKFGETIGAPALRSILCNEGDERYKKFELSSSIWSYISDYNSEGYGCNITEIEKKFNIKRITALRIIKEFLFAGVVWVTKLDKEIFAHCRGPQGMVKRDLI